MVETPTIRIGPCKSNINTIYQQIHDLIRSQASDRVYWSIYYLTAADVEARISGQVRNLICQQIVVATWDRKYHDLCL